MIELLFSALLLSRPFTTLGAAPLHSGCSFPLLIPVTFLSARAVAAEHAQSARPAGWKQGSTLPGGNVPGLSLTC